MKYRCTLTLICTLLAVLLFTGLPVRAAGPDFNTDVTINVVSPDLELNDTDLNETDWEICVDSACNANNTEVNEGYHIGWVDGSSNGIPFKIETGTGNNLLYLDAAEHIGINTNVPAYTVDAIGDRIRLRHNTSATARTLMMRTDGSAVDLQSANADLYLRSPGYDIIMNSISGDGNVGIGTNNPIEKVDVFASSAAARFQLTSRTNDASQAPQYIQRRARISGGAARAVQTNDNLGLFTFRGHTGSGYTASKAYIAVQASENWSNTRNGTKILLGTTQNGSTTVRPVMEITHDARVRINGTTLNVPDYVFEDNYKLMPLDELKAYVESEKKLPKISSATKVNSEGLDLGGTQMAMLEKVEELTLYTIQQHEQLKDQQLEISALQKQNENLRKLLDTRLEALEALVKDRRSNNTTTVQ